MTELICGRRAREGLIAGGNLFYAGHCYYQSVTALLDCAPSLDLHLAEPEAGLAILRRTGDEQTPPWAKCRVTVHAQTALTPSSGFRVRHRSGEWGRRLT